MSHSKEREEKICLNCGAPLTGRYCHICGQENTEPKETVWGLISHFFNDITHFDGKFFSTVKCLLTKPGFLSSEYIKGRRAGYLHPIRMYVFTSAFFFIIVFSLFNPENLVSEKRDAELQLKEFRDAGANLREKLVTTKDTVLKSAIQRAVVNIDSRAETIEKELLLKQNEDSLRLLQKKYTIDSVRESLRKKNPSLALQVPGVDSIKNEIAKQQKNNTPRVTFAGAVLDYRSQIAYDSVQKELPANRRDAWLNRTVNTKAILYQKKWKGDKNGAIALFMEKFMHNLPKALFVSLPLFALLLLMLYSRRPFYYTEHGIFSIHLYCAIFIFLLVIFGFNKLIDLTGWNWLSIFSSLIGLGIFFYLYKAMRRFYRQGRWKTILKFVLLNLAAFVVVMTLVIVFFLWSLWQFS